MSSPDYRKGIEKGLQQWGTLCSGFGSCEGCPVHTAKGAEISCQEFAMKFPGMMAKILESAVEGKPRTYYAEYCSRFPNNTMPLDLVARSTCRRAVFEGALDCEVTDDVDACIACWNKPCLSDVESPDAQPSQKDSFDLSSIDF